MEKKKRTNASDVPARLTVISRVATVTTATPVNVMVACKDSDAKRK